MIPINHKVTNIVTNGERIRQVPGICLYVSVAQYDIMYYNYCSGDECFCDAILEPSNLLFSALFPSSSQWISFRCGLGLFVLFFLYHRDHTFFYFFRSSCLKNVSLSNINYHMARSFKCCINVT